MDSENKGKKRGRPSKKRKTKEMPKEEQPTGVTPAQKKEKPLTEGTPDRDKPLAYPGLHEASASPILSETPTSRPGRGRGRPSRQRQGRSPKGTFLESSGEREKRESRQRKSPADSIPTTPTRSSSRSTRGRSTSRSTGTEDGSKTSEKPTSLKHPRGYHFSLSGGQYAAMFPTDELEVDIKYLEPEIEEQEIESENQKSERTLREANLLLQRLKAVQKSRSINYNIFTSRQILE